jgi:hypothetical protein
LPSEKDARNSGDPLSGALSVNRDRRRRRWMTP